MAAFWFNDAGTWRKAAAVWLNDASTWRKAKAIWFNDAGTWRKVFTSAAPALNNRSVAGDAAATASFRNDGTLVLTDNTGTYTVTGEWLSGSPGTVTSAEAGAFDIQFTYVSGPNTHSGTTGNGGADKSGDAYATWLNLATTRSITVAAYIGTISGTGGGTLVFDAAIRPAGGGSTLASARFTLSCSL